MTAEIIRPAAFTCEPLEGRRKRLFDRIMAKVRVHLPREGQKSGCWEYLGGDSGKAYLGQKKGRGFGYGRMSVDGVTMAVHIVMFIIIHGPVPAKKQIDHAGGCWTRKCCNFDHLQMVTHLKNQRLRAQRRKAA